MAGGSEASKDRSSNPEADAYLHTLIGDEHIFKSSHGFRVFSLIWERTLGSV
jgi:hypothetical protein